ncbi:MAG: hypothetical protein ACLP7P_13330 [Rhodomicrobium sp.]
MAGGNFRSMDESERYEHGTLADCRAIAGQSLKHGFAPGIAAIRGDRRGAFREVVRFPPIVIRDAVQRETVRRRVRDDKEGSVISCRFCAVQIPYDFFRKISYAHCSRFSARQTVGNELYRRADCDEQ